MTLDILKKTSEIEKFFKWHKKIFQGLTSEHQALLALALLRQEIEVRRSKSRKPVWTNRRFFFILGRTRHNSLSLWPSPIISISRNPLDLPERLKSGRNFFPLALPEVLKVICLTFSVFRTQSNELVTILGSYIFNLGPFPPVSLACLRWNPKKWPENVLKPFLETYSSRIYPRATCRVLEKTRCY